MILELLPWMHCTVFKLGKTGIFRQLHVFKPGTQRKTVAGEKIRAYRWIEQNSVHNPKRRNFQKVLIFGAKNWKNTKNLHFRGSEKLNFL